MRKNLVVLSLTVGVALGAFADGNPVIPFLAVTGRPTEADIVRKVAALKADGCDAFLVYPRSGLQYRYMGEEWLNAVDLFCREADKNGMKVWLYDEYNWPSGTCKGRVPNENDKYRYSEWAVYREKDGSYRWQNVLAPPGWVNVLDDGAMSRFLELTHEVYEKRLAKWFAKKLIRGIFTDEPGHPTAISYKGKPVKCFTRWETLEAEYAAATGGDFRKDVESFLDGKRSAKVWEVYAELQGKRFRTNYFDRINAWCRKMGVESTGHMISEHIVCDSCRRNGNPLVALKGESLPGMDEIGSRTSDPEWLTLAVAQHAATRNGNGGLVELYALGPNDMPAAHLRQMIWLASLFGIDRYLASMQVMDHKGLVEKHGYLSPVQEGQPWHAEARVLFADAQKAAKFARKLDCLKAAAIRYPQKAAARHVHAGGVRPEITSLLGAIGTRQMAVDLIEETEATTLPFVFEVDGATFRETRTGTTFTDANKAAEWLQKKTAAKVRYYEEDGKPAMKLVAREYSDGASVALDIRDKGERRLIAEIDGKKSPCVLPARGVIVLAPGERPQAPEDARTKGFSVTTNGFDYALDRDNVMRIGFDRDKVGKFIVDRPIGQVKLVLRDCALSYAVTDSGRPVDEVEAARPGEKILRYAAVPYAFELDGKPVKGVRSATSLPVEYNPLYLETEPLDLAPGEHVLRIASGEADRNFFLPAAFVAGAFAAKNGRIGPLPAKLGLGSLANMGLGSYCGAVTYRLTDVKPFSDTIRLNTGGLFTRVSWNGVDLGTRAWAPYEWKLPRGERETNTLEVKIFTPVVNILGEVNRPGADWDVRFWRSPRHADYFAGLQF